MPRSHGKHDRTKRFGWLRSAVFGRERRDPVRRRASCSASRCAYDSQQRTGRGDCRLDRRGHVDVCVNCPVDYAANN